jgi:hypothetical protein
MLIQFLSLVLTLDYRPILRAILSSFVRLCSICAVVLVEHEALLFDMELH